MAIAPLQGATPPVQTEPSVDKPALTAFRPDGHSPQHVIDMAVWWI
jgi:hypothetical protein